MKIKKDPTCVSITFSPTSYWLYKSDDEERGGYMLCHRIDMSYKGKEDQVGEPVLYLSDDEAEVFKDAGFSEIL